MSLIPPFFLSCVVAIGVPTKGGNVKWVASGFLYGNFIEKVDEKKARYRVYLVTNRHVLKGKKGILLRFNPKAAEAARMLPLKLKNESGEPIWYGHSDEKVDVAIIQINADVLKKEGIDFKYFLSDKHAANIEKLNEIGLSEGDGIFVLGFPMGLVGNERNYVIVRQGAVARVRDMLAGHGKEFLIDTFVFPGNSGGPVVVRPELTRIENTKSIKEAYLIGVIAEYVPYQDVAISTQTKRPRVIFEENSGLTSVVSVSAIQETIDRHFPKSKSKAQDNLEVVQTSQIA